MALRAQQQPAASVRRPEAVLPAAWDVPAEPRPAEAAGSGAAAVPLPEVRGAARELPQAAAGARDAAGGRQPEAERDAAAARQPAAAVPDGPQGEERAEQPSAGLPWGAPWAFRPGRFRPERPAPGSRGHSRSAHERAVP
jgi:hypothetical protein